MKNLRPYLLYACVALTAALSSCSDDSNNADPTPAPDPVRQGLYVLSEGLFNANNTLLSYFNYDTRTLTRDQFGAANAGKGIGDTGNDIKVYGSKMYIVVNVSSTIEVLNAKTAQRLQPNPISLADGGTGRQPRYIVFNKNKAFISTYDGNVAVLDTATLTIDKYIKVGRNPEQMAIANNKLYVANSGGLDYPNYDNTVSVIDLNTLTETKKITVGLNPGAVATDQYGDVYVKSTGNYGTVKPSLVIINSQTDAIKQTLPEFSGGSKMVVLGDYAYMLASGGAKIFNVKTETVEKERFVTDGTVITSPYGIAVDPQTGEVFITDAKNYATSGEVTCFDKDGNKKYSIATGLNPNNVVFINK